MGNEKNIAPTAKVAGTMIQIAVIDNLFLF